MSENFKAGGAAGEAADARGCGRTEELVAYLYGEATKDEALAFREHLSACAVCSDESAAFAGVREAVADWRAEALGALPALDIHKAFGTAAVHARAPKRSALAAFREFFALSPAWLRAGSVAAALAVCALAALTLARAEVRWDSEGFAVRTVRERVVERQVQAPAQGGYTQEQVEAIVAKRLEDERTKAARQQQQPTQGTLVNVSDDGGGSRPARALAKSEAPRRARSKQQNTRRDDSMLASDDNLPRLSDLLGGSY